MRAGLTALLTGGGATALTALVSSRIWWTQRPQSNNELPAVVLTAISGRRDYTHGGASNLVESRVQADIYAKSANSARETAAELIAVVNAYRGTAGGTVFQGIFIDSERDLTAPAPGGNSELFRISIDLRIWHDE